MGYGNHRAEPVAVLRIPRRMFSHEHQSTDREPASPDPSRVLTEGERERHLGKTKHHASRRGVRLTQIFFSLRPSSGRRARRRDPGKAKDSTSQVYPAVTGKARLAPLRPSSDRRAREETQLHHRWRFKHLNFAVYLSSVSESKAV